MADKRFQNFFNNSNPNQDKQDCPEIICRKDPFKKHRLSSLAKNTIEHECPLTRDTLGKYSWSILHTFAAYYPQKPNELQKSKMLGILEGYKYLYPCTHCRAHFQRQYDTIFQNVDPPRLDTRTDLTVWLCRQHNLVNKLLGKSEFDCSEQSLLRRWKTGCNDQEDI